MSSLAEPKAECREAELCKREAAACLEAEALASEAFPLTPDEEVVLPSVCQPLRPLDEPPARAPEALPLTEAETTEPVPTSGRLPATEESTEPNPPEPDPEDEDPPLMADMPEPF